jgi:integrase
VSGSQTGVPRLEAPVNKDFLFSVRGFAAVTSFDHAKLKLDERMTVKAPWRLHDLRRTATTGLAKLGIPPHVADRVLNHQSGKISGVAAIYNRYEYINERRAALQAWGRYIEALLDPSGASNIVSLKRA